MRKQARKTGKMFSVTMAFPTIAVPIYKDNRGKEYRKLLQEHREKKCSTVKKVA